MKTIRKATAFPPIPPRALQLKLREYALAHTSDFCRVVATSSDARHRTIAAEALGYARQSRAQIAALALASFDADDHVRNDAIRALSVMAAYDPKIVRQIPSAPYVEMLHSLNWTDRNKTMWELDELTKSRDPKLLGALRSQALTPLREMAQWSNPGHSTGAIDILGRIASIDENRIGELVRDGKLAEILNAFR